MLERRTIQLGNRLYEVRLKPAIHKRKAVAAIQILRDLGTTKTAPSANDSAIRSRIFASPNLTMYIAPSVLETITRIEDRT